MPAAREDLDRCADGIVGAAVPYPERRRFLASIFVLQHRHRRATRLAIGRIHLASLRLFERARSGAAAAITSTIAPTFASVCANANTSIPPALMKESIFMMVGSYGKYSDSIDMVLNHTDIRL